MTRVLDVGGVVELAVVERNGLIESRHLGAAVVLGPDGDQLAVYGDADALVFPRSSLKPVQAVSVLRAGVALADEELVLATASHSGTPEHIAVVERMLASAGLTPEALQTPVAWPTDPKAAHAADGPSRIAYNCSGKHAAFLAAAVANGWSTEDYLDPAHPLQVRIRDAVGEFTGDPVEVSGVDGCGAPLHAVTLRGLARGIARLLGANRAGTDREGADREGARLAAAVRKHPWAIDGPGRANTVVIEETGVIAKGGAEGVLVAVAPDGTSVALKSIDGSARATTMIGVSLLARAGAVEASAAQRAIDRSTERVTGGAEVVGAVRLAI